MTMATMTAKKATQARTRAPQARTQTEASVKPAPAVAPKPSFWTRVKNAASKTAATIAKPFKAVARKIKPAAKTAAKPLTFAARGAAKAAKQVARAPKALMQTTVIKTVRTKTGNAAKVIFVRAKNVAASSRLRRLWRAIRTYLVTTAFAMVVLGAIVGMFVAPVTTILFYGGVAAFCFLAAYGLEKLERSAKSGSKTAQRGVRVVSAIDYAVQALALGVAAIFVVAGCLVSVEFLAFTVLAIGLDYFGLRAAYPAAACLSSLLVGDIVGALSFGMWWMLRGIGFRRETPAREVPEYSEMRRRAEQEIEDACRRVTARRQGEVRPVDAPNDPEAWTRGNFLRAKGTEELWGTEHDRLVIHDDADEGRAVYVEADDNGPADDEERWEETWRNDVACEVCTAEGRDPYHGAMRVTAPSPYLTEEADPMPRKAPLCTQHYTAACEEDALKYTGTSLDKRSCEVRLNQKGIEASVEFMHSRKDPSNLYWLETAWWRDRRGDNHPREWGCLHQGNVVATVVHDYRRKVYRATALGRVVPSGVKTSLNAAKRAAADELNDEGSMLSRIVETFEGAANLKVALEGG